MAKQLEAEPKIAAALKDVGTTAREYSLTMIAMYQTSMMVDMHSDVVKLSGVIGDNVDFLNTHPVEVEAFFKSAEKLSPKK